MTKSMKHTHKNRRPLASFLVPPSSDVRRACSRAAILCNHRYLHFFVCYHGGSFIGEQNIKHAKFQALLFFAVEVRMPFQPEQRGAAAPPGGQVYYHSAATSEASSRCPLLPYSTPSKPMLRNGCFPSEPADSVETAKSSPPISELHR